MPNQPGGWLGCALLPGLALNCPKRAVLANLQTQHGPGIGLPRVGSIGHRLLAFVKLQQFFARGHEQPIAAHTAQADPETGKTPSFAGAINAGGYCDVGTLGGTKEEAESIQRRAGQFQKLIAVLLFHRESTVEDEELLPDDFSQDRVLEIILVDNLA